MTEQQENAGEWLDTPPGCYLNQQELTVISRILPKLFGYHIIQLGDSGSTDFLAASNIAHQVKMQFSAPAGGNYACSFIGDEQSVAVASDSVDVVVLPHVLEFADNPHKLLREVERILIGEGHLLMTCLNPWSLWGAWRLALFWREQKPWSGHMYSFTRIRDWLSLLDFELVEYHRIFYRPPLKNATMMQRLSFLEKIGKWFGPVFCGTYVILAKKRVISLTPIKTRWHKRRKLIASGVLEPGTTS